MRNVLEAIRPGDLVFDVGANTGEKVAVYLGAGAKVVAVEPQPQVFAELEARFGGVADVKLVNKGLGATEGTATLSICTSTHVISTFSEEFKTGRFRRHNWDQKVEVEMTTLDKLIELYGDPRYCKIDVEGFELEVLGGLSRAVPLVSIEFHPEFMRTTYKCLERLIRQGYVHFNASIGDGGNFGLPTCVTYDQLIIALNNTIMKDNGVFGEIYASPEGGALAA